MPILMAVNLNPKTIVTVLFKGLTFAEFLVKVKSMAQALVTYTGLFPTLNPTPANFQTEVNTLDTLETKEKNLVQQLKANTEAKNKQKKKVNDIAVNYASQIQNTTGVTVENIKKVGFGVKGVDDQQAPDEVKVANSKPTIEEIDQNRKLEHTLTIHNDITGKIGLPNDAKHADVYEFFGGAQPPVDIKKMTYLGAATRGKYTNHFLPDQVGQLVWYIVVYVPKKKGGVPEISNAVSATVL